MPELPEGPFANYLREVDEALAGLPTTRRSEICLELFAHLADAAEEEGTAIDNHNLQKRVIDMLGSSLEMGFALYEVHQGGNTMRKRLFDICISMVWLVVLSPLFLLIALLIKLDSKGPVFYRDSRMGRNGRRYSLYKFRSMKVESSTSALTGNDRITRVGRLLRKISLDELPQLWNVLTGDMSIVGPRPAKPLDVNVDDPSWRRVLLARPGITGLSQVQYGFVQVGTQQRLETDLTYLEKQSLSYDLHILRKTLTSMFKRDKG